MGFFAEAAIEEAMRCLVEHDNAAAAQLVDADVQLDELETEAERRVVELIALRAPMADDLREAIAALKIAGVVERIGDYAKNIARRVRRLPAKHEIEPLSLLPEMAKMASAMVHDVLKAFVERDAELAQAVCARDDALDDFYESIFRTLLTYMMENPQNIGPSTTLLFVAKNLERIGDHATNIAEMVYYAATGERLAEAPLREVS
jgi:phosphate transport system protein